MGDAIVTDQGRAEVTILHHSRPTRPLNRRLTSARCLTGLDEGKFLLDQSCGVL